MLNAVQLNNLLEFLHSEWLEEGEEWVLSLSVAEFDRNNEEHAHYLLEPFDEDEDSPLQERYDDLIAEYGAPTHVAKIVFRSEGLELVDGELFYPKFDGDELVSGCVWMDALDGSQPSYYGGPIDESRKWVRKLGEELYVQIDNPVSE